jgi:glutamyl-tRNA reductase
MTIYLLGVNHRSASLDIREKVVFAPENMTKALQNLIKTLDISEAAILSTCNRTEIYIITSDDFTNSKNKVLNWLTGYHQLMPSSLDGCYYAYENDYAVRHLMRVASGLDSMILGEPQILGQLKSSYAVAQEAGTVSVKLNQLFQQAFLIAKRVRTKTAIGQNPVSVAYAGVKLSQQIFSNFQDVHVLLIGAGETIELVARHLLEKQVGSITVSNRTLLRAEELAQEFNAHTILFSDIPEFLEKADILISSTGSQLPILGKGAVESAIKRRKHKPMFMLDLAVPRDIEPEVAELDDIYLFTIDDLQEVILENMRSRENAADKAEKIIEDGVIEWKSHMQGLDSASVIRNFRKNIETTRDIEVQKALVSLHADENPEEILRSLARNLTNKFMHTPSKVLKQALEEGRQDDIRLTNALFGLKEIVENDSKKNK